MSIDLNKNLKIENEEFIRKNINLFSDEEFIDYIKQFHLDIYEFLGLINFNKRLYNSRKLLEFILFYHNDISSFNLLESFNEKLFTEEIISHLSNQNVKVSLSNYKYVPLLLNEKKYRDDFIEQFLKSSLTIDINDITKTMVSVLEYSKTCLSPEELKRSPLLLDSDILVCETLKKFPNFILELEKITIEMIRIALKSGYKPCVEDFYINSNLTNFQFLVEEVFAQDTRAIIFFSRELIEPNSLIAIRRGYIPAEDDLIKCKTLTEQSIVMQVAIQNNPYLIKYISKKCYISSSLIDYVLNNFDVDLTTAKDNKYIAKQMVAKESTGLSSSESLEVITYESKKKILIELFKKDSCNLDNIDFLSHLNKTNFDKFMEIALIKFDDSKEDMEEFFLYLLHKIIEGVALVNYSKSKKNFEFTDVVSLSEFIKKTLLEYNKANNLEIIKAMAYTLFDFSGQKLSLESIVKELLTINELYKKDLNLNNSIVTNFCNDILNFHRSSFISSQESKLIAELLPKLELTRKKKSLIINGEKLKFVKQFIKDKDFVSLRITEDQLEQLIDKEINKILNNKRVKNSKYKSGILESIELIREHFKENGDIKLETCKELMTFKDDKIAKIIFQQFNKINLGLINNIVISKEEDLILDFEKVHLDGLNYNNFIIGNYEKYLENLAELLLTLSDDDLTNITNNITYLNKLIYLLPLVNLINDFNMDSFKNIVIAYDRIRSRIIDSNTATEEDILNKIADIILLANSYSKSNNLSTYILGEEIIDKLDNRILDEYLSIYEIMLKRQTGNIPPISFATTKFKAESGNYADPRRLIIGKVPFDESCICLENLSGAETFIELVTGKNADVVLLSDLNNNMISRFFIFRRGNVIQMVSSAYDNFPIEVYKEVADKIMQASIEKNDNIDYIFVNNSEIARRNGQYITVKDDRLISQFPHADFQNFALLINSKEEVLYYSKDTVHLDFDVAPEVTYFKPRREVYYNPSESEIMRIRAIDLILNNSKNDSQVIIPFYTSEYNSAISGEDWYIAETLDGQLEEVLITSDPRAIEEFMVAKKKMIDAQSKPQR